MRQFVVISPRQHGGGVSPAYNINELMVACGAFTPDELIDVCQLDVNDRMRWDESHIQRIADTPAATWLVTWWTIPLTGIMQGIQLEHTVTYPTHALAVRASKYIDLMRGMPADHRRDFLGDEYTITGTISVSQV